MKYQDKNIDAVGIARYLMLFWTLTMMGFALYKCFSVGPTTGLVIMLSLIPNLVLYSMLTIIKKTKEHGEKRGGR